MNELRKLETEARHAYEMLEFFDEQKAEHEKTIKKLEAVRKQFKIVRSVPPAHLWFYIYVILLDSESENAQDMKKVWAGLNPVLLPGLLKMGKLSPGEANKTAHEIVKKFNCTCTCSKCGNYMV